MYSPVFKTVVLASFLSLALAGNLQETIFSDDVTPNVYKTDVLIKCMQRICSRIYRPVCVSINGSEITLPSRCYLAKQRCLALMRNLQNPKAPRTILRVLHDGGCYEKSKSKKKSKKKSKSKAKRRKNSKFMRLPKEGKLRKVIIRSPLI